MELVPVVIISKQQGIPIPSNNFTFTLSKEDFEKFITTEVDIRGAPLKDTFLISVSEEDTLALNLLLNPQEKLESTAVIGVFCQLVDVDIGPFERYLQEQRLISTCKHLMEFRPLCKSFVSAYFLERKNFLMT